MPLPKVVICMSFCVVIYFRHDIAAIGILEISLTIHPLFICLAFDFVSMIVCYVLAM